MPLGGGLASFFAEGFPGEEAAFGADLRGVAGRSADAAGVAGADEVVAVAEVVAEANFLAARRPRM